MSDLVVVTYPDEYKAAEVLAALQRLEEKLLIDMEDAAYVVKGKDGKVKMHETVPLTKIGAASGLASGTFWEQKLQSALSAGKAAGQSA